MAHDLTQKLGAATVTIGQTVKAVLKDNLTEQSRQGLKEVESKV